MSLKAVQLAVRHESTQNKDLIKSKNKVKKLTKGLHFF